MSSLRQGRYGNYYGCRFWESDYLTEEQQQVNALYIYSYFKHEDWSDEAIAGILGNMQAESTLNPGCWQSHIVGNYDGGYGLVQWTPASNYIEWCETLIEDIDNQLDRIMYELNNGLQWISTRAYPMSFKAFTKSTKSPATLASAFLKNYERAGVEVEDTRRTNANNWYKYLTNKEPAEPEGPGGSGGGITFKKKKRYKFHLFRKVI